MNKSLIVLLALLATLMAFDAFAQDGMLGMRRQADSQFRIAEKAYRKAIKDYGDSLDGLPLEEKTSACKKMSSALHDNKTQYNMEDVFGQMKYKKQIKKLETYNSALGCNK